MAPTSVPRSCAVCGKNFMMRPSIVERGGGKYCSYACRDDGNRTREEGVIFSAEYAAWSQMKTRCLNTADRDYPNYGGRGITVCNAWHNSFDAFLADVGQRPSPKHSIDRWPDNNGNYEPGNVRWATGTEQARNRRSTVFLTHGGETHCMREWAAILGMANTTLHGRLKKGWSVEHALTASVRKRPAHL